MSEIGGIHSLGLTHRCSEDQFGICEPTGVRHRTNDGPWEFICRACGAKMFAGRETFDQLVRDSVRVAG